jgi:hypothetical protein
VLGQQVLRFIHQDGALENVPQLPHVSGPVVARELADCASVNFQWLANPDADVLEQAFR